MCRIRHEHATTKETVPTPVQSNRINVQRFRHRHELDHPVLISFQKQKILALFVSAYKRILDGKMLESHPNIVIKI